MTNIADHATAWLAFLTSPAAPKQAMSLLELDGYLTGVIVAPAMIAPGRWLAGLWADEEPVFDDEAQLQSVLDAVRSMFNILSQSIDTGLRRLEADRVCQYRPAFLKHDGEASRTDVKTWTRGFWKAMSLDPAGWSALVEDERTQVILTPFVGFIDTGPDPEFEPASDIDARLDAAAAEIPRAILILRKIARLRASRNVTAVEPRRKQPGRNDPCPCGSGKKYKRCCGQN